MREFYGWGRDRSREEVAAPGNGSDQLLRIVIQRTPDLEQALSQRIVRDRCVPLDGFDQFRLGHQPAAPLDQISQDLE